MEGGQSSNIKKIFSEALDISPADLPAFLTGACGGDSELEAEILSLLESHRKPIHFFDPTVQPSSSPDIWALAGETTDRFNWVLLDEQPGTIVDRYKLLDVIGQGGHGVVFRAEQNEPIHRVVALKVIRKGTDTDAVKQRFEAERQTLALLDHPNIAKLFDAGSTAQGRSYFVMELVAGSPVTLFCDVQRFSVRRRVELFITICRAVQHAHQKGIIHRDLKPSNILIAEVDGAPAPKIIDFGVARMSTQDQSAIEEGHVIGTPQYMSPEDTIKNSASDIRSDVYSLGAVLCELLAGTMVIDWDTRQIKSVQDLQKAFAELPRDRPSDRLASLAKFPAQQQKLVATGNDRGIGWQALVKLLRPELDAIILKATQIDRKLRYDSVAALADDLQRYLEWRPVSAVPAKASYLFNRFCARNKIAVVVSLAVIALLMGALLAASGALIRARAAEAAAITHLGESYLQLARSGETSRRPGQRARSLHAIKQAAQIERSPDEVLELRNEAIACMSLVDVIQTDVWDRSRKQFFVQAKGADLYAVHDLRGDIQVFCRSDHHLICTLPANQRPVDEFIRLSNGGKYLANNYRGKLRVTEVQTQRVLFEVKADAPFSFGDLDDCFAVATADGNVEIRQLPSGVLIKSVPAGGAVDEMRLSPGEDRIAVWAEKVGLRVIAIDTAAMKKLSMEFGRTIAWSPDGCNIAVTTAFEGPRSDFTNAIEIFNITTGTLQAVLTGYRGPPIGPTYSQDGRLLLSAGWDDQIMIWDACNGNQLLTLPYYGENLVVHSDVDQFSFLAGANVQFWQLATSKECQLVDPVLTGRAILSADMSVDGTLMAGATSVGIRLWEMPSGRPRALVSAPGVRTVLFSPDGKRLFASTTAGVQSWSVAEITSRNDAAADPVYEGETCAMAMDESGDRLVFGDPDGTFRAAVPDHLKDGIILGKLTPSPRYAAISPDGNWAARSSRFDKTFDVWNLQSGTLAAKIPRQPSSSEAGQMAFSSESKTLLIPDTGWYSVGDWKLIKKLPGPNAGVVAFSPDGKLLALSASNDGVILADPATGKEFATLKMPANPCGVTSLKFSRDSQKLIVTAGGTSLIVWNIPLIRRELAEMNLNWDTPATRPGD